MKKRYFVIKVIIFMAIIIAMGVKIKFMSVDYSNLEDKLKEKNDYINVLQENKEDSNIEVLSIMDDEVQTLSNIISSGFDPSNGENYYFNNHNITINDIKDKLDSIEIYHTAGPSPLFMIMKAIKENDQYILTVKVIFPDYNATTALRESFPYYIDYDKTTAISNPQVDANYFPVSTYNNLKQGTTYTIVFDNNNNFISSSLD